MSDLFPPFWQCWKRWFWMQKTTPAPRVLLHHPSVITWPGTNRYVNTHCGIRIFHRGSMFVDLQTNWHIYETLTLQRHELSNTLYVWCTQNSIPTNQEYFYYPGTVASTIKMTPQYHSSVENKKFYMIQTWKCNQWWVSMIFLCLYWFASVG